MQSAPVHVLFLNTSNTARSVMAEVLLRDLAGGRARCFSAGTSPVGKFLPEVENLLSQKGFDTVGVFSKSLQLFLEEGAPHIDLVVTICDSNERMPVLGPLGALRVHWELPNIVEISSTEEQSSAIKASYCALEDSLRQVLHPSWQGLTLREIQRLFEVVAPLTPILTLKKNSVPESFIFELDVPMTAYA
ncbi:hypothetical protein [Kiloniella sp.]|uniref:arsenate reductase/protein-tyrosine-phosphatase family protein n=1 Tax=Kiloniella sp. TaxID=1938587 RepID=UPI003B0137E3